ncbi:hypothetical protein NL676_005314 [Syzygium grande]|nr:hypothetical protein NL676_005314 [Syzygium grande]
MKQSLSGHRKRTSEREKGVTVAALPIGFFHSPARTGQKLVSSSSINRILRAFALPFSHPHKLGEAHAAAAAAAAPGLRLLSR